MPSSPALVDVTFASLFLGALYFAYAACAHPERRLGLLALSGLAAGLAAGTKHLDLLYAGVLTAALGARGFDPIFYVRCI